MTPWRILRREDAAARNTWAVLTGLYEPYFELSVWSIICKRFPWLLASCLCRAYRDGSLIASRLWWKAVFLHLS